ncbi:Phosphotransferase [Mucor velutinosus]|uniref:Enhancer of polycomb-like protein n=1 Tax=Mucor velutinosus TaxID=708070 RepID=A0AAN7HL88_9FUNG|nr:Phosphotransferase [Mucor velutinosus]
MVSRFRVKKLSPKHPLPIFKEYQLPDLQDAANAQRSVPQIETGVEKEEEEEHDLQAAISAAQAAVTTGASVEKYIPTPDASCLIPEEEYRSLYKKNYKEPSTLIRFSSTVEDSIGCPYYMDEQDEAYLESYNKEHPGEILSEDLFEKIIWEIESIASQHWPHLDLDPSHIPDFKSFDQHIPDYSKLKSFPNLQMIFQHWRQRCEARQGKSIIPQLKFEEAVKNENDPYVCFRRRETKPVRKTRRTDQQSLERLRKLRSELEMARNLMEMVVRREKIRKEGLVLEHTVFEKKRILQEYQKTLGIKEDEDLLPSLKKKRKIFMEGSSGATIKIPLHKLRRDRLDKSPAQLAIEAELARKKEMDLPYEDCTESPYQPFPFSTPQHFFQSIGATPKDKPKQSGPKYRKRMGRNGRIFIDRKGVAVSSEQHQSGGKSRPGVPLQPTHNQYKFDSDVSEDEHSDEMDIDEMDSLYLQHRVKLLSENELRNLVTIPFLTPLNMMSINNARSAAAAVTNAQQPQHANGRASPASATMTSASLVSPSASYPSANRVPLQQHASTNANPINSVVGNSSASVPIKRQNSRTKMTPQQAAVAMANGMIAANMAAVVNNSNGSNKAAMQRAMAAAQQQQQQLNSRK